MKSLFKIFLLTIITIISIAVNAQDVHFSQFYETPLYRNPALAGLVNGDVRVQSVYRTQWNNIANAYKTASLSAEYKMPVGNNDDYVTAGLQMFYDKAGTAQLTSTQVLPALNFHKSISQERNTYLSLGFMGGIVQRRLDRSKITTNSQFEGSGDGETFASNQYTYLDGSVGMSLNSGFGDNPDNNYILGVAYHHFNKPKNAFYQNAGIELASKYVASAGVKFGITETSYLKLEADHYRQGGSSQTVAGIMYGMKIGNDYENPDYAIHGGAFIRWNDAFIPTIKVDYQPFSVGLSYDVNISKLKTSSYGRGGYELSLTYTGFLNNDNSSMNAVRCPRY